MPAKDCPDGYVKDSVLQICMSKCPDGYSANKWEGRQEDKKTTKRKTNPTSFFFKSFKIFKNDKITEDQSSEIKNLLL